MEVVLVQMLVLVLVLELVLQLVKLLKQVLVQVFLSVRVLVLVLVKAQVVVLGTGDHKMENRQNQDLERRILSEEHLPGPSWCQLRLS